MLTWHQPLIPYLEVPLLKLLMIAFLFEIFRLKNYKLLLQYVYPLLHAVHYLLVYLDHKFDFGKFEHFTFSSLYYLKSTTI